MVLVHHALFLFPNILDMKYKFQPQYTSVGYVKIIEQVLILIFKYSDISEKAMAPHSSTLAWKIPWTEEPGGLQAIGREESDTTERLHFHFSLSCIGEGNGNPLQCSCLEDPRDRGAWWAAVYGVAQSQTRLKYISSSSIVIFFKLITQNVISSIILFLNMQINCRP